MRDDWRVLTADQRIEASRLEQEIRQYFDFDTHLELCIQLDRSCPPIEREVAVEVVARARTVGLLAQCTGERLVVKCPSRFRSRPCLKATELRRTLLR